MSVTPCRGGGGGWGVNAFAKNIDSRQPAQPIQADLNRNLCAMERFSVCHRRSEMDECPMRLQKVSSQVSLRRPGKLNLVETLVL